MGLAENRHGVLIIPKKHMKQAAEKLAAFEDIGIEPEGIINLRAEFRECVDRLHRAVQGKKALLTYIDEIDGQILDDPVALIREKVEELL